MEHLFFSYWQHPLKRVAVFINFLLAFYLLRDEIKCGKNRCGGSIYRSYTNLKMTYYTEKIFLHFLIHSTRCEEPGKELRRKKKSLFLLYKAADFLFYHRAIKNKFITFIRRMKTQILLLELFLRDIYFCIFLYFILPSINIPMGSYL